MPTQPSGSSRSPQPSRSAQPSGPSRPSRPSGPSRPSRPSGSSRRPWDRTGSEEVLRTVRPEAVGLDAGVLAQLPRILRAGMAHHPPRFSGASLLVASRAGIAFEHADGYALRWQDASTQLPEEQWIPARIDTIFDVASLSKLFTATAVMQLVEQGRLGLEDRVAGHLPRFAENGKGEVTIQHLLSHVGGLPPFIDLYSAYADIPSRLDAVLTVAPTAAPGTQYVYSDLGLITLGLIVETLTGQGLDEYVRQHITAPLGMTETRYTPPAELRPRIAATEHSEHHGRLVHGHVHDENAWSLGGVAGHAGVFSTARDLAILAQMFLGGGRYGEVRVLEAATVQAMFTDRIAEVTGPGGARRGLGPELGAWFYHSGLTSPFSGAHTGFTGTSLVIDPLTETVVILLTNAVHPTREWSTTSVTRREVSTCVARALGVVPETVRGGWHGGDGHDAGGGSDAGGGRNGPDAGASTATLGFAVNTGICGAGAGAGAGASAGAGAAELRVELFFHLETTRDLLAIEASADGGETWALLPGRLEAPGEEPIKVPDGQITGWGRRTVWDGVFPLADREAPLAGEIRIRLRRVTDGTPHGLGAWVGRLRVLAAGRSLFDSDRPDDGAEVFADGWVRGA